MAHMPATPDVTPPGQVANVIAKGSGTGLTSSALTETGGAVAHAGVATPTESNYVITADGLGALSFLTYSADNVQIGFDSIWTGNAHIARDTSAARIVKGGDALRISGASGLSLGGAATLTERLVLDLATGAFSIAGNVGFNGATPAAKPTITGSRGGNAALASLLTALAAMGLITDGTS